MLLLITAPSAACCSVRGGAPEPRAGPGHAAAPLLGVAGGGEPAAVLLVPRRQPPHPALPGLLRPRAEGGHPAGQAQLSAHLSPLLTVLVARRTAASRTTTVTTCPTRSVPRTRACRATTGPASVCPATSHSSPTPAPASSRAARRSQTRYGPWPVATRPPVLITTST